MSFLKIKKNSIYLNVTNNPKLIRPLFRDAEGRWVHNIPSCSTVTPAGKKEILRYYRQVDADFSQWMKNNQDPLWDKLDQMDKFDRQGNRQDFSVRPVHVLPVWDHEEQTVKIAKQGNQFFEEFVKWYDQGGDVTACDWMVYTEGSGRRVQYKVVRQDQAPFQCPLDQQALQVACQEMMTQALNELRPFKTEEDMIKFIYAQPEPQQGQIAQGQAPQSQNQMPGYTPGGAQMQPSLPPPATPPPANPYPQTTQVGGPVPQTQTAPVPGMQMPTQPQVGGPVPQTQTAPTHGQQPQAPAQGYQPQGPAQGYQPQGPAAPAQMPAPVPGYPPQAQGAVPGYVPSAPPAQGYQPQGPAQGAPAPVPPQGFPGVAPTPQQDEVPNAPVSAQPVYAPPVQTQIPQTQAPAPAPQTAPAPQAAPAPQVQSGPGSTVLDFGKYSGKTLAWVLENDRSYLTFLKGNKKHLAAEIEQLLAGNGATAPAQAASAQVAHAQAQAGNGADAEREQLLDMINQKFLQIPDFQGPGIASSMMPFLTETIGTTDFSNAPLPDLVKLNEAVDAKLAQQGA